MSERELGFLGFSAFFLFLLVLAIWRIGQEMKKSEQISQNYLTVAGDLAIQKLHILALEKKFQDQLGVFEAEVDELQAMLEIARQNFVDLNRVLRQAGFDESRNDRLIDGEWDDETKEDDLPDAWR